MAGPLCDLWKALIADEKDRGKIYEQFKNQRKALADHIENCDECKKMLRQLDPMCVTVPYIHHLSGDDKDSEGNFAHIVRQFSRRAKKRRQLEGQKD